MLAIDPLDAELVHALLVMFRIALLLGLFVVGLLLQQGLLTEEEHIELIGTHNFTE